MINDESLISKGKELHAFVRQGLVIAETLIIPSRSSKIYKGKTYQLLTEDVIQFKNQFPSISDI